MPPATAEAATAAATATTVSASANCVFPPVFVFICVYACICVCLSTCRAHSNGRRSCTGQVRIQAFVTGARFQPFTNRADRGPWSHPIRLRRDTPRYRCWHIVETANRHWELKIRLLIVLILYEAARSIDRLINRSKDRTPTARRARVAPKGRFSVLWNGGSYFGKSVGLEMLHTIFFIFAKKQFYSYSCLFHFFVG